jgi:hypothetical protein
MIVRLCAREGKISFVGLEWAIQTGCIIARHCIQDGDYGWAE